MDRTIPAAAGLAGDGFELAAGARLANDVLLGIDRGLQRVEVCSCLLRPEPQLLKRRAGQIVPGLRHAQRRLRARKRAVLKKIEIQQRSVAVGGGRQPLRGVGGDEKRFRQGKRPLS
ncbi:MAG: hypothetical protein V8S85_08035 [Oscillospiraceae bacterium]